MRLLVALAVALLTVSLGATAVAAPQIAEAKKCFKKKSGKRVRVKCPKKKVRPPSAPAPAPPAPAPMTDPGAIAALTSVVNGQELHQFATSSFHGDEKLSLCADGSYKYAATLDEGLPGLTGAAKPLEFGSWRVTGADFSADRTRLDGGLLLAPADGTPVHLVTLAADAAGVYLNGAQWYASAATLCG